MHDNDIVPKSSEKYTREFITHKYFLKKVGEYIGIFFHISDDIYCDMIRASDGLYSAEFLFYPNAFENERYLIYRFIRSILLESNPKLTYFKDEQEYKHFCENNNFKYDKQCWFKRVYIKDSYENAESYILRNSIAFQKNYFPDESPCTNPYPNLQNSSKLEATIFKSDFQESLQLLKTNDITKLYHFTDRININSILKNGGLLSYRNIRNKNITVSRFSSNEISREMDVKAGLDNFVRLSFTSSHPMMHIALQAGRIFNPVIIEIDPTIALMPGALFSNVNALKKDANIGPSHNDLSKIKFKVVKQRNHFELPESEKPFFQAEVLVEGKIGCEMFLNLETLYSKS
jgi:hypothetical protein